METQVSWYPVPDTRPWIVPPTAFASYEWEESNGPHTRTPGTVDTIGEQMLSPRRFPVYRVPNFFNDYNGHVCGTPEEWLNGTALPPDPPIVPDLFLSPTCCGPRPLCFVHTACGLLPGGAWNNYHLQILGGAGAWAGLNGVYELPYFSPCQWHSDPFDVPALSANPLVWALYANLIVGPVLLLRDTVTRLAIYGAALTGPSWDFLASRDFPGDAVPPDANAPGFVQLYICPEIPVPPEDEVSTVKARSTVDQILADATNTPLDMGAVDWDDDGWWDAGDPTKLTCPPGKAGKYSITGSAQFDNGGASTYRVLAISKNGASTEGVVQDPGVSGFFATQVEAELDLAVGDYVELVAAQYSGGNLKILKQSFSAIFSLFTIR